jgi:Flp pilus assembly pilin Flp
MSPFTAGYITGFISVILVIGVSCAWNKWLSGKSTNIKNTEPIRHIDTKV